MFWLVVNHMENEFCFVFSYLKKLRNPHTHTQTYLILITYGIICLGNFQLIFLLKKNINYFLSQCHWLYNLKISK